MLSALEIFRDFLQMPMAQLNGMIALAGLVLAGFAIFAVLSVVNGHKRK